MPGNTMKRAKKAKRVILFDNDGTLSDSVTTVIEATNMVLAARGYSPSPDEEIIDGMRIKTTLRMLNHVGNSDENLGTSLANDYYAAFFSIIGRIELFEGVAACLKTFIDRSYVLGIVSNNASDIVDTVLSQNQIRSFFSLIVGEDNAEETKPGPGGLLQACRLLDVKPENSLYVGDSLSDSVAAEAAGMPSIGIKWNHHDTVDIDTLGFTFTVDTPDEILSIAMNH